MYLTNQQINLYANTCQSQVSPKIIESIIKQESSGNTSAIAVIGEPNFLQTQSDSISKEEFNFLNDMGKNFSVGLMQINKSNFSNYSINKNNAFNICKNIKTGASIYFNCYNQAKDEYPNSSFKHLEDLAFSCYYSGNFKRGFLDDHQFNLKTSYVERMNNRLRIKTKMIKKVRINLLINKEQQNQSWFWSGSKNNEKSKVFIF